MQELNPNSSSNIRYGFLDSLRGFAAIWVVLFHLNEVGQFPAGYYQYFVKHGSLGVTMFFVISGFAVQLALQRSASFADFLSRRAWRIYPPYLASIVLTLSVILARKIVTGSNDLAILPHSVTGWIQTLTLTTTPVTSTPTINWVYWTLSYEVAFYLVLSTALLLPKFRWWALYLPTVVALFAPHNPVFFLQGWCFFGLGVALAAWNRERGPLPALLGVMCMADMLVNRDGARASVAIATFLLIALATSSAGQWLNREPLLRRAGISSYSLYLIHVPIGCWFALQIDRYPRPLSAANLVVHIAIDLTILAVCMGAAFVFWRFIEEPASRRFKPRGSPCTTPRTWARPRRCSWLAGSRGRLQ